MSIIVTYKYTAISKNREKVNGVVEGFNELDAVERIKESCDVVLKITPAEAEKKNILTMDLGGNKLDDKAFTVMCSQFAIILRSGIPVARATQLIADKTTDKKLKRILKQVADDVESGRSLSASFEERGGNLFPPTFIETLRAGEESGSIDRSFESMHASYDKANKMRGKVRGALAYPIFVLVIAVAVVIVLMVKVVPTFTRMFEEMGAQLPLPTRMLIGISHFFQKAWPFLLIAAIVIFVFCKLYGNTETGRTNFAKLARKVPVLGEINVLNSASQFANTMASMLAAGLPIVKSVSITAKVIDNYFVSQEIGKLSGKLEEGRSLGATMRECGVMPDILTDMVAVGEETGEMEQTMRTIGGYYDSELLQATESALKKLEPTLLVGLAVIAGFIVIAIYLAMFSMYGSM